MEILQRLFYTALSAASIIIFIVKVSLSHWKKRGILHDKPKFLTGNMSGVGRKRHISTVLQQLYEKYKGQAPFIGCYAYLKPMVLILDLELVKHVLVTDAQNFLERGIYSSYDVSLSCNMFQVEGEGWQRLHDAVKPFFTDKLPSLLPTIARIAANMQRALTQSSDNICAVNLLVDGYNVDVISTLAFGVSGESLLHTDTEFRRMTRNYQKNFNIFRSFLLIHFPRVARILRCTIYEQTASDYFIKLVQTNMQDRTWSGLQYKNDFLQLFIDMRRSANEEEGLSDKQIAAQAFSFILLGLDTCNSVMTFCLYELALQPDLQQSVRKEVESVLKSNNGDLSMDSLAAMQLLRRAVYETMRKYTPHPFLLRKTSNDYEVPNSVYMLQQCNHLVIPVAAIHQDSEIYPEPDKFDPDRFSAESLKHRHSMAFLPFGAGPRACIARQLAEVQIMVGLATLLQDYSFSPCRETPIPMVYNNARLVLTPLQDLKLQVQRIQQQ